MTGGMAKYEIGTEEPRIVVRVFMRHRDETSLLRDETEAKNAVLEGFLKPEYAGKVGNTLDPYKVAEKILAMRYGYAKMVEAHCEWRLNIRY